MRKCRLLCRGRAGGRPVDKYLAIICQCTFLTQTVEVTHVKMKVWNGYKWRIERAVQVNGRGLFSSTNFALSFQCVFKWQILHLFVPMRRNSGGGGCTNVINHLIKRVCTLRTVCGNVKILVFHPLSTFYDFHTKKQTLHKEYRPSVFLMETRSFLWS